MHIHAFRLRLTYYFLSLASCILSPSLRLGLALISFTHICTSHTGSAFLSFGFMACGMVCIYKNVPSDRDDGCSQEHHYRTAALDRNKAPLLSPSPSPRVSHRPRLPACIVPTTRGLHSSEALLLTSGSISSPLSIIMNFFSAGPTSRGTPRDRRGAAVRTSWVTTLRSPSTRLRDPSTTPRPMISTSHPSV